MTWAPALYGNKLSNTSAPCVFRSGSTGPTPSSTQTCGNAGSKSPSVPEKSLPRPGHDYQSARRSIKSASDAGRVLCDSRIFGSYSRPQYRILSLPLRLKWQGRPHLAKANGVGSFRWYWNLLNASLRTTIDAAVSHDRVHLRTIALPHRLGSSLSIPSRVLRGSVQQPLLMSEHLCLGFSTVSSTTQMH